MGQHMHLQNTQDTYIYSEADEGNPGDKAIIESNQFTAQQVMVISTTICMAVIKWDVFGVL